MLERSVSKKRALVTARNAVTIVGIIRIIGP